MRIFNVVGARPNFMKVAPVHAALVAAGHDAKLIHTGQHYDEAMSAIFFQQLGMPTPDVNLEVGSASHAVQTARIMEAFEPLVLRERPELVLVAGDVNSTIACALVAKKLHVAVAHLEAGLRSFDMRMPEEINRVLTDRISDLLLTPSPDADDNLRHEGADEHAIARVGNAMIDSLRAHVDAARALATPQQLGLVPRGYALVTLHRPSNVDDEPQLRAIMLMLAELSHELPVLFPMHPRTRARLATLGLASRLAQAGALRVVEPLGYLEFLGLQADARLILTDSGGIQEESTALGVPCLTARENTERPITISEGTNTLVGTDTTRILAVARDVLANGGKQGRIPALWDGQTAKRVVAAVARRFG
ncbi:MAG: UDP-N-acetylglucosamine 2-epimerase (non-hydrolyzing) [Myxococcota bacterium]